MTNATRPPSCVSVKKYVRMFTLLYAVLLIAFQAIVTAYELDLGSSAGIGILVGAVMGASVKFVTEQQRAPNKIEKRRLVGYCLLASLVVSFASMLVMVAFYARELFFVELYYLWTSFPFWVWGVGALITLLMHWMVLAIGFGWTANLQVKQLEKQKQKQAQKQKEKRANHAG